MKGSCFVEPLVDNVSIHAPFSQSSDRSEVSEGVNITHNSPYNNYRTYAFLRPNDSINFADQGLTVAILSNAADSPDSKLQTASISEPNIHGTDVQVESSNMEPDANTTTNFESEEDTEDESDLDQTYSARSQPTSARAAEVTPATSHVTEPEPVPTIKETPNGKLRNESVATDDDQPYSTARDVEGMDKAVEGDPRHVVDVDSPSFKVQQRLKGTHPRLQNHATLEDADVADRAESEEIDEAVVVRRMPKKTYGKRSRQGTPQTATKHRELATSELPDTDPSGPLTDGALDDAWKGLSSQHTAVATSDAMEAHDYTTEAARRSLSQVSTKRKLARHGEDGDEGSSGKKLKLQRSSEEHEAPEEVSDGLDGQERLGGNAQSLEVEQGPAESAEDEDAENHVSKAKTGPKAGKGRLQKSTQAQLSADNIVVATRSSPDVVVKRSLRTETPASSAATVSPTPGKVPKILLSTDSAASKNISLKKWLKDAGATTTESVPTRGSYFVCVVPRNHTLKSAKVLHSLAMRKLIVTDDWLTESKTAGVMLDPTAFVHKALEDDITHDRSRVFANKHLFFTTTLVADYKLAWADIQAVAKEAGAAEVAKVSFDGHPFSSNIDAVFFGSGNADNEVSRLIHEYSRTVYSKDYFTHAIISGELKSDAKFKLKSAKPAKKTRRS